MRSLAAGLGLTDVRNATNIVVVRDTFTRANSATTLGSAETGQAWTALAGTWGITSNTGVLVTNSGANKNSAVVDALRSDGTVQATIITDGASRGITFRRSDVNNGFIVDSVGVAGTFTLFRLQAGAYTSIGTGGTSGANATVGVVLNGAAIAVVVNGVTVLTVSDAFNQTATKHGLQFSNTSGVADFDNFLVTASLFVPALLAAAGTFFGPAFFGARMFGARMFG